MKTAIITVLNAERTEISLSLTNSGWKATTDTTASTIQDLCGRINRVENTWDDVVNVLTDELGEEGTDWEIAQ